MSGNNQYRYVLVTRKTRLQELVERFNTWPQAKFYLEHNNVDACDYLLEHDFYQQQLAEAERILKTRGRFQQLDRSFLPQLPVFSFGYCRCNRSGRIGSQYLEVPRWAAFNCS